MSTAIHGSAIGLLINGFDLTSAFRDFSMEASQEPLDFTGFGNTAKVKVPGLKEGKASGEGWLDTTATTGSLAVLKGLYTGASPASGNPAVITRSLNSSTFAVGSLLDIGYFETANLAFKLVVGDLEKVTFQGDPAANAIDYGVSLHALSAETSFPLTGTAVDNAALTSNGGLFVVHVTALAGSNKNVVIKVQHSTDNSTYIDLATASAITAANSVARIEVAAGTTIRRYLKVIVTDGGTTSSCTFVAGFARR